MTDERRDRLAAAIEKAWDNQDSPEELARDILAADPGLICAHDPAIVAAGEAVMALPVNARVERREDRWLVFLYRDTPTMDPEYDVAMSRDTLPAAVAAALPAEEAER